MIETLLIEEKEISMICFPNAKINIGLNVLAKRKDGFHDIQTVLYPIPFCDILELVPSPDGFFSIKTSGIEISHDGKPNLCERAFRLLETQAVKIFLHKCVPAGTGLGAGSSNGVFTLAALNEMFSLGHDNNALKQFAAKLGSDCPFFVENVPVVATGRGEYLETCDVNLGGMYVAIVLPDVFVSTATAYSMVKPNKLRYDLNELVGSPISNWKDLITNDFEAEVFRAYPVLAKIKNSFYQSGACFASMTGTGSAIYGIYNYYPELDTIEGFKPLLFRL